MLKAETIRRLRSRFRKPVIELPEFNFRPSKSVKRELYRKFLHLSCLWIPAVIYFLPFIYAFSIFAIIFVGDVALEWANYRRQKWARKTYGALFFKMLRRKEVQRKKFEISGSVYVLIAAMACVYAFSKEIAVVAMSIMLISDTSAAVFGKIYGTRMLRKNKSVEGTFAFLVSALVVVVACNPLYAVSWVSVVACFAAVLVELFDDKLKLDDNLSVPLITGFIMTFIG